MAEVALTVYLTSVGLYCGVGGLIGDQEGNDDINVFE